MSKADRISIPGVAPKAYDAMLHLENAVAGLGLERRLYELIKIRASQINGCAFCIDMHTKDARADGETEQRIYLLDAWREAASFFTERERAALALTEAITLVTDGHVSDEVYAAAAAHFDEKELGALVMAAVTINAWNRIAISCRTPAGIYEPRPRGAGSGGHAP